MSLENTPKKATNIENETKSFLYHMVPEDMKGSVLHPLNDLENKYPEIFKKKTEKYQDNEYRQKLMQKVITALECKWNDVIHMTAVHPEDLKEALKEGGVKFKELNFYQIDPESLDPSKTVVYLYNDVSPGSDIDIAGYKQEDLSKYSKVRPETVDYYKKTIAKGDRPKTFVGIPHVLYKGSFDISQLSVITVDFTDDKKVKG